jgi:RNA 3'-terminal phosphate cyclase (ATP)
MRAKFSFLFKSDRPMSDLISIDGAEGEGGGQIVRSALTLAMVTGRAFEIYNIRGNRARPGLLKQHLTAVKASREICGGGVSGAKLGSSEFIFAPGPIECRDFQFDVGSAGSTSLVAQTLIPALMSAKAPSSIQVTGGTHNRAAPPYHFLEYVYLPLLNRMGGQISARLDRWGFYPRGDGHLQIDIQPAAQLTGLQLKDWDTPIVGEVIAVVSGLSQSIAERECEFIRRKSGWPRRQCQIWNVQNSAGPGNVVMIRFSRHGSSKPGSREQVSCELFTAFGRKGVPAEKVAEEAWQQAQQFLRERVPVGEHLCDQLLLPLSLAAWQGEPSEFVTGTISQHSLTQIELIPRFLGIEIRLTPIDLTRNQIQILPLSRRQSHLGR